MTNKAIEQTLEQLYSRHKGKVSDKWSIYLSEYGRLFQQYRHAPVRLLEIGIQNGGSLDIWSKFFPKAQQIVGCDINPDCAHLTYKDPRISVVVGDANSDAAQAAVLSHSAEFDLIIDDGSHLSSDIVKSFARYFPYLLDGGIFVVEDLHCSYWKQFEGGLFDPFSSMAFFKRLADVVSHEHWGVEKTSSAIFTGFFERYDFQIDAEILRHIHSIEFINSMCVIRKLKPEQNVLGPRFIAGSVERIVPGHLGLHLTQATPLYQADNAWAVRNTPPDEELSLRLQELADCDAKIGGLAQTIAEDEKQIELLQDRREFINELRQAVAAKDEHIRKLDDLVQSHAQGVADRDQQIASLNQVVAARQADFDGLSATFAARNAAATEAETRIRELNRVLGEHASQITSFTHVVSNREGQIAALTQAISARDEQLAVLNQNLARMDTQNSALTERLSERDRQITSLHETTSERDKQIDSLRQSVAEWIRQSEELRRSVVEGQSQISTLVQSLAERESAIEKLTQTAVIQEDRARSLEKSVADFEGKVIKLTSSVAERDEHLGRLIQSMADSERQIDTLNRGNAGLVEKILVLDGTTVEQALQMVAMTSAISEEQSKVIAHEQALSAREAHIIVLNQEMTEKANQISMLHQEIKSREARKFMNVARRFFRGE